MKLLIAPFLLISFYLSAQSNDSKLLSVYYSFSHITDTTKLDKMYKEQMVLDVSKNISKYYSRDYEMADSMLKATIKQQMESSLNGGGININLGNLGKVKTATKDVIYFNAGKSNKEAWITTKLSTKTYLYNDILTGIKWAVGNEEKKIKGFSCQKATGSFRGRDYEVWFCADLPYSLGPWKLTGLPGLILEAFDTKKQVFFSLDKIEKFEDNTAIVAISVESIRTTKSDFDKMVISMRDALFSGANLSGELPGLTEGAQFTNIKGEPNTNKNSKPNNPLELIKN